MDELIVFTDEEGRPTGEVGPKLASHTSNTKRHLAFSCYILRHSDNSFLLTQRALSKKVWPGVWTNSVCGHPAPGEKIEDAVLRRAMYELGIPRLDELKCLLPNYKYNTPPYEGIVENEFCPVFLAYTDCEPNPNPNEVASFRWIKWPEYVRMLNDRPHYMSYWAKDQYRQLAALEPFVGMMHKDAYSQKTSHR